MRAERARVALVALTALPAVLVAGSAWGYVRSRVENGCRVLGDGCYETAWSRSAGTCIPVTIYLNGFDAMTPDEVAKSVAAAAHAWSPSSVTCPGALEPTHPFLEIVPSLAPLDAAKPEAKSDARNVVVFETSEPLDDGVIALTTLANKLDGRILDADVQINAVEFEFRNLDPGSNVNVSAVDLQAAITHEFGHFLGLGHTCFEPGGSDLLPPINHLGDEVPFCNGAPADVESTVMFAIVQQEDIRKRTLTADDVDGVCAIYPAAADPHRCVLDLPDDGCGCQTGGAGGRAPAALLIGAWLTRGRARRGRRARTPRPASTRR